MSDILSTVFIVMFCFFAIYGAFDFMMRFHRLMHEHFETDKEKHNKK